MKKGIHDTDEEGSIDLFDVLVVGGGVVGLAILRAFAVEGYRCALLEKEPDLLTWASGSNSGIVCTGIDALPGTLERALIRDAISQIRPFCEKMNVPTRQCGSIVCHWPWDDENQLDKVLSDSYAAGDTHAVLLTAKEVQELEPNVAPLCDEAVHIKGEIVIDPWLYSIALAVNARQNGAKIFTDFEMDLNKSVFESDHWLVVRKSENCRAIEPSSTMRAKVLINATGLWSDLCLKDLYTAPPFAVRPRRGQYRIYRPWENTSITHPIQPVPTQFTKGIFLFSTIYGHIVVGPTAQDQESRTDRTIDETVSMQLAEYAKRILPDLDLDSDFVGEYVGVRPGTDQRDYQIHVKYDKRLIICAGIRSTGLTSSLGIGRYVLNLVQQTGMVGKQSSTTVVRINPLPSIAKLAEMFRKNGNETVEIDGHVYRVTHPLTRIGFGSL